MSKIRMNAAMLTSLIAAVHVEATEDMPPLSQEATRECWEFENSQPVVMVRRSITNAYQNRPVECTPEQVSGNLRIMREIANELARAGHPASQAIMELVDTYEAHAKSRIDGVEVQPVD
jgi:hypothetical protein